MALSLMSGGFAIWSFATQCLALALAPFAVAALMATNWAKWSTALVICLLGSNPQQNLAHIPPRQRAG
eukprot:4592625-Lingulodinium_polyedra.AAC.1